MAEEVHYEKDWDKSWMKKIIFYLIKGYFFDNFEFVFGMTQLIES